MISKESHIVITGAAGFIGSALTNRLNNLGFYNLFLVDDFNEPGKEHNLEFSKSIAYIEREVFFQHLEQDAMRVDFIFHLGARTDTTEFDYAVHQHLNVDYSEKIWTYATSKQIPLVYASSAATYGNGEFGYSDAHDMISKLQPLNPYGISKNEFDKWALAQQTAPPFWVGLKFFNVYGPNEYHKGRMASVIFHAFHQIRKTGQMKLFRSHIPEFRDGQQLRDFIYVEDIIKVCIWLTDQHPSSGIYNLGTGKARSFYDLVAATFNALGLPTNIEYIDMPEDIRDKYQYFTEAEMQKLIAAGYSEAFTSLEAGVDDYVRNYLLPEKYITTNLS